MIVDAVGFPHWCQFVWVYARKYAWKKTVMKFLPYLFLGKTAHALFWK